MVKAEGTQSEQGEDNEDRFLIIGNEAVDHHGSVQVQPILRASKPLRPRCHNFLL